jgi:hypothetical protein
MVLYDMSYVEKAATQHTIHSLARGSHRHEVGRTRGHNASAAVTKRMLLCFSSQLMRLLVKAADDEEAMPMPSSMIYLSHQLQ